MTPEQQKRESAKLDFEQLLTDANDRVKHQVDLGKAMLQSLTVVNGGAIVALFTLIGNQGGGLTLNPSLLKLAFGFFITGLLFSLLSSLGGFLSQYFYAFSSMEQAWDKQDEMLGAQPQGRDYLTPYKRGNWALIGAIASAALSLTCFGIGSWIALSGFLA